MSRVTDVMKNGKVVVGLASVAALSVSGSVVAGAGAFFRLAGNHNETVLTLD